MTRLTVDLSSEISDRLTEIAQKQGITKAEAMRRAFALLSVADKEQAKGNYLGIIQEDPDTHKYQVIGRLVGI